MKAFSTMFKAESRLMLRDMNIPIFGVGFPVIFAVILGLVAGATFLQQSFGALVSIGICATGLMGMPLTISDYRHRKVLKRFKVTPVSPAMLLLVQFVINLMMSLISLLLVYAICALLFGYKMTGTFWTFILSYLLVLLAMYGIGMMLASVSPDLKTANLLCSLVYFPMLLLSGATVPYEVMPRLMQKTMDFLPQTQGIKLLKASSLGIPAGDVTFQVILMLAIAAICIIISLRYFRWE